MDLPTLNDRQRAAVTSDHNQILVIAPAGSGKTHTFTHRVARLLEEGANPARILCVTFTRSAAAEMKDRVRTMTGARHLPDIRTVHSWCANLLRRFPDAIRRGRDFTIYDEKDREDLIRVIAEDLDAHPKPWTCKLQTLEKFENVMDEYPRRLQQGNALDFDQLENLALWLLQHSEEAQQQLVDHYDHVLIDEFQDTNFAQALIFSQLRPRNLFVVGDPRQSVYRFRGAKIEIILERAARDDWEVIQLVTNYRSVPSVVDVANHIAAGMDGAGVVRPMEAARVAKVGDIPIDKTGADDYPIADDLECELDAGRSPSDFAVLARQWKHLQPIRRALEAADIPVRYMGKQTDPWDTNDGRMLARALRFWVNPTDLNLARWLDGWGVEGNRSGDFREVKVKVYRERLSILDVLAEDHSWGRFQRVRRVRAEEIAAGREPDDVRSLLEWLWNLFLGNPNDGPDAQLSTIPDDVETVDEWIDWYTVRRILDRVAETADEEGVVLTTVHGAKGLEWPVVYLASAVDGVYPTDRKSADAGDLEEDRRVFYVAATRARDRLVFSFPTTIDKGWGDPRPAKPTRFLDGYLEGGAL